MKEFQQEIKKWCVECFGEATANNTIERNYRFLEESLELVQSCGCTKEDALKLVDYVFSRPIGDKLQEVGGVMVTFSSLCNAQKIDLNDAAYNELQRVQINIDKIRAKHNNKSIKASSLPI